MEFSWSRVGLNLAEKYQIQIDEIDIFIEESIMLASGLSTPDEYAENLVVEMGIPKDLAQKLIVDANEQIFLPLQKAAFRKGDTQDEVGTYREVIRSNDLELKVNPTIPKPSKTTIQNLDKKNFEHPYSPKEDVIKIAVPEKSKNMIHLLKNKI